MAGMQPRDFVLNVPNQPSSNVIIASFSNGRIAPQETDNVEFQIYQNKETEDGLPRKRARKILVARTKRLEYVGYNYGPEAFHIGNLCRYHLGILNKKKGKMKLFDMNTFHCQPVLEGTSIKSEDEKNLTNFEKRNLLTSTFGSKKKKKAMESTLRYDVEGEHLTAATEDALAQIHEPQYGTKVTKKKMAEEATETIPLQNKNATSVKDVYSLDDIATKEELDSITVDATVLIEATPEQIALWRNEALYAGYVLRYLPKLSSTQCDEKLHKAKLLILYHFLTQILKLRYKELKRKDPIPEIPMPLKKKLIDWFTLTSTTENGTTTRSMPPRMKDKIVAYAFVLVLFLENFTVDLSLVQADFKMSLNRIVSIAYALGCHVNTRKTELSTASKVAELKLPLFVPNDRFQRGRR